MLDGDRLAILFAAMHPERVRALVRASTSARFLEADDYPIGASLDVVDTIVRFISDPCGDHPSSSR